MSDKTTPEQEPSGFKAVLRPHRSLGSTGFVVLMTAVVGISLVAGLAFYLIGAWPVLGFFGLDALLIYLAFKLSYRSGRTYETVDLNSSLLTVMRVHPSGKQEQFTFNPYWVHVRLAETRDGRTDLQLRLHDRKLSFGRFLTDEERRELARALTGALIEARGGVRI